MTSSQWRSAFFLYAVITRRRRVNLLDLDAHERYSTSVEIVDRGKDTEAKATCQAGKFQEQSCVA